MMRGEANERAWRAANYVCDALDMALATKIDINIHRHVISIARDELHDTCCEFRGERWHDAESEIYLALFDALSILNSAIAGRQISRDKLQQARELLETARNLAVTY